MTYEEALIKWAVRRYELNPENVGSVRLNVDNEVNEWCETCGPEHISTAHVVVFDTGGAPFVRDSFDLDWYEGFSTLLKEILEAAEVADGIPG